MGADGRVKLEYPLVYIGKGVGPDQIGLLHLMTEAKTGDVLYQTGSPSMDSPACTRSVLGTSLVGEQSGHPLWAVGLPGEHKSSEP